LRRFIRPKGGELANAKTVSGLWSSILEKIKKRINDQRFNLWFSNTRVISIDDCNLTIGVPNLFVQEWLEEHYVKDLNRLLHKVSGDKLTIKFVIDGRLLQQTRRNTIVKQAEFLDEISPNSGPGGSSVTGLKRELTFDSFVVGPCNELAYAAARRVVRSPGAIYNPLFIHGPVGIGKTHLLQSICHSINLSKKGLKATYISGEAFSNQFIHALQTRSIDAFRHKFRNVPVLIIDDVHFLANKRATQEEFLYTFNSLDETDSQIVMASDSHPKMIGKLKASLTNRFVSGMVIQLDPPDYQTRIAILRSKFSQKRKRVGQDVIEFMAKHFCESVRELEGAINVLIAYSTLTNSRINVELAASALESLVSSRAHVVGIRDIERVVADYFQINVRQLHSRNRCRSISYPRQLCMYLARSLANLSYNEIAKYFGGKNHTAAISAFNRISRDIRSDSKTIELLAEIKDRLHTSKNINNNQP